MNGLCGSPGMSNLGMNRSCGNPAEVILDNTQPLIFVRFLQKWSGNCQKKHNVFNISEWKYTNWPGGVAKFGVKKLNGSRNESTARKMARGKTQTAAEWRACIKSHRKFIWFGKIRVPAREIPLASQKGSPESFKKLGKHTKKLDLWRFWGSLLGI